MPEDHMCDTVRESDGWRVSETGWSREAWLQCWSQRAGQGTCRCRQGRAVGLRVADLILSLLRWTTVRQSVTPSPPSTLHLLFQLRESSDRRLLELVALPSWLPAALANFSYYEAYPLDSSSGTWTMRRDIPTLGRTRGQIFMTTDNILVFR